jgi:cysteine desulfurase/selenocysteine lyase
MSSFRALFPFFKNTNEVYLDTAATSQKLDTCLLAMEDYYQVYNANVHRGNYASARQASNKYESARTLLSDFLGASSASEIIFTSGATDSINIVANGLNISDLQGKEILLCESEHHANLLPWQHFAKKHNLVLKRISLDEKGRFNQQTLEKALQHLSANVAIIGIAHVSNALGNINPVEALCQKATQVGAISIVDGTQAAAHINIDVNSINCDFYAISGHKMYAGTGIGVLYGKQAWLDKLSPSKLGGEMITRVTWDSFELQASPGKFEAGTPNIAGAIGMAAAGSFIKQNITQINTHELALRQYLLTKLEALIEAEKIIILGNIGLPNNVELHNQSIAILSFYSPIMHANDIASHLSTQGIAIRAGHHCAMPLMQSLGIEGSARISLGCYTTFNDIDALVLSIQRLFDDSNNRLAQSANVTQQNTSTLAKTKAAQVKDETIEGALKNALNWNAKHRLLLLNSKRLPMLIESKREASSEILGCEAKVWLTFSDNVDTDKCLLAYSESKVIRGILALLIEKVNTLSPENVHSFNFTTFLVEVGLSHYFSEGRRDGVQKIIYRIRELYISAI